MSDNTASQEPEEEGRLYVVQALTRWENIAANVFGRLISISWEPGSVGFLPVFKDYESAHKYTETLDGPRAIIPIHLKKPEPENDATNR